MMNGWKPIETVPREPREILLYSPRIGVCLGILDTRLRENRFKWAQVYNWGGPDDTEEEFTHWCEVPHIPTTTE